MWVAIDELVKKHANLISEKRKSDEMYDKQISDLSSAIETLSGKKVWEVLAESKYDDESPDYIKGSFEEI